MCGRFTLSQSPEAIAEAFALTAPIAVEPRYNIAPTQDVLTVRATAEGRSAIAVRWGLVPSWSKDPSIGARMINARSETVAEKPSFRSALRSRRCLVVADGFYEWQKAEGKKKPYYICLEDSRVFAFAGLWERSGEAGKEIETCTIITTAANELMMPIHERMPVILDAPNYEDWLDPDEQRAEAVLPLLRPYSPSSMVAFPVSTLVNSPSQDKPELVNSL
ncbi:MAG: SOS response-associated peptidase [Gemmatimonadaceae bacterium]|nr:SOS response-associated peptidase [Gloeobacterales cyanobacterium ES-bin-141]